MYDKLSDEWHFSKTNQLRLARKEYPPTRKLAHLSRSINPLKRHWGTRKPKTQPWGHLKSGFTKLPLEIRMMIYDYVFGGTSKIHITLKNRRVYGIPCTDYHEQEDMWSRRCIDECRCPAGWDTEEYRYGMPVRAWPNPGIPSLLSLLLTCQFMYTELSVLTYTYKTFIFTTPGTLLLFTSSLAPHALQMIRNIRLDSRHDGVGCMLEPSFETPLAHLSRPIRKKFRNACPLPSLSLWVREDMKSMPSVWGAAWKMIAEMKGLESIKVFLVHTNFRGLWSETVGTTLEDGYWGETTKMKSEKFIMKPLAQTAEILGDGVKMEVNTDWVKSENEQWNEGLFGVKRWKWVLYVGPEKCRFRLKHYE